MCVSGTGGGRRGGAGTELLWAESQLGPAAAVAVSVAVAECWLLAGACSSPLEMLSCSSEERFCTSFSLSVQNCCSAEESMSSSSIFHARNAMCGAYV